jgi:hypothetical protein
MGRYGNYSTHAHFHTAYLEKMFTEKNIFYSKNNPKHVMDESYLKQLQKRIKDNEDHLHSFQGFIHFCQLISNEIR